jgi:circadian clock protein KaiB
MDIQPFVFVLFIMGTSLSSEKTIHALRQLCETTLKNNYVLEIVNVLEAPDRAETHNILATPTLIRESPLPHRRIIGDLSNIQQVAAVLGLDYDNKKEAV